MNKDDMENLWKRLNVLTESEKVNCNELLELSITLDKYIYEFMIENYAVTYE